MQTIYEGKYALKSDVTEEDLKKHSNYHISLIEYDWINHRFRVTFGRFINPNGDMQTKRHLYSYHEFIHFFLKKEKSVKILIKDLNNESKMKKLVKRRIHQDLVANPSVRGAFKKWQWQRLLTDLWLKTVNYNLIHPVKDNELGYLFVNREAGYKCSVPYKQTTSGVKYANKHIGSEILAFENKYKFRISIVIPEIFKFNKEEYNKDPVEYMKTHRLQLDTYEDVLAHTYIGYLQDQFGSNMEFDFYLTDSKTELVISMAKIQKEEPKSSKAEFVQPGN